jgi:predicted ATPase
MERNSPPFFVFTGGPGVGKSTTLAALQKKGFRTFPESARSLMRGANTGLHKAHPKKDLILFRDKVLEKDIEFYKKAHLDPKKIAFFDRGILDILAFDAYRRTPHSKSIDRLSNELIYNKKVFFFPPWEEIFETDPEREESFEDSVVASKCVQDVYYKYHYELIEVPKGTVESRVTWILENVQKFI